MRSPTVAFTRRPFARWTVAAVIGVAVVAALRHLLHGLRLDHLRDSLARAAVLPLVAACACTLVQPLGRAVLWKVALSTRSSIPLRRLLRYTVVASATSVLLPLRAGEAVRVWLLARFEHVPAVESASIALAERVIDLVAMVIVLAPLPLISPSLPTWVRRALVFAACIALLLSCLTVWLARRQTDESSLIARALAALRPLRSPPRFSIAVLALVTAWVADAAAVALVAHAIGIDLPKAGPLLVLLAVNLAIGIPTTPGQIGVHEAGSLIALSIVGIEPGPALAFALLYHAAHVLPTLAVAGLNLPMFWLAVSSARNAQPSALSDGEEGLQSSTTPAPPADA